MTPISKIGRYELCDRLAKAEATIARVSCLVSQWHQHIWSEDHQACALELEDALKGDGNDP